MTKEKEKKKSKMLTRGEILDAADLARELVEIPEWQGSVYVQSITGFERDAFESRCIAARKNGKLDTKLLKAQLVILSLYDEDGSRIFNENDINGLNAKSGSVIDRLFNIAQTLSGLSDDDVDELAGNSAAVPSGGSGSNSPVTSG